MKLSLCLPLENEAEKIPALLTLLGEEIAGDVEIILCDNASTDQTEVAAREFVRTHPRAIYYKSPKTLSKEELLKTTTDLAHGEFCWLLNTRESFQPGNVQRVLPHLTPEITGLSLHAENFPFLLLKEDQHYSNAKKCLGDLLLYLQWSSGHIFKRSLWNEMQESSFAHTVAKMILKAPQWKYAHTPMVSLAFEKESLAEAAKSSAIMAKNLFGDKSPAYFSVLNRAYSRSDTSAARLLPNYWALPSHWTRLVKQTYSRLSRVKK